MIVRKYPDFGTDDAAKLGELSKKFQTAFDRPSFLENYIAILLGKKWLHIGEEI